MYASQLEAEQAFSSLQHTLSIQRKLRCSYSELESWFRTNKPYKEIGDHYGVTRQRMQQIYAKYFQPFMDTPRQRMTARLEFNNAEGVKKHARKVPKLETLRLAVESFGLHMDPVPTIRLPNRASHYFVDIGEFRCKIQVTSKSVMMSPRGYRYYWRFTVVRHTLGQCDFNIFICGEEGLETFFIVPPKVLVDSFKNDRPYRTIYICTQNLEPYNNKLPEIPFWDYNEAWAQLGAAI